MQLVPEANRVVHFSHSVYKKIFLVSISLIYRLTHKIIGSLGEQEVLWEHKPLASVQQLS